MIKKRSASIQENPWDDEIVPRIILEAKTFRYAKVKSANTQRIIMRLTNGKHVPLDLKIQLKRAQQLAYIEPWFQSFLPPNLKNHLFICSIGRKYWLISAQDAIYANRFRYCQQEIQKSLEAHLNKISQKEWTIPPFKVQTVPKDQDNAFIFDKGAQVPQSVPLRDTKTIAVEQSSQKLEALIKRLDERAERYAPK